WKQLAFYYRTLHPRAAGWGLVQALPDWHPRAEAFVICGGAGEPAPYAMIIYPQGGAGLLEDTAAWELIGRALPPDLRGAVGKSFLDPDPHGAPGPYLLENMMIYSFTSGANVTLEGDPDQKLWSRIEIIGRALQGRWNPIAA